ncbi:MAG: Hsp20/alpha crystallin family protein [Gammaproteobacteria bacterium]
MSTVRELTPKTEGARTKGVGRTNRPFLAIEDFFENLLGRPWMMEPTSWKRPLFSELEDIGLKFPRIDLVDHDKELIVRAELPGVKKEEIEIDVEDDFLTLRIDRDLSEEEKTGRYYRSELAHGSMERMIPLPVDVVANKAKAELKDGILEIVVPKAVKSSHHKVEVR